MAFAERPRRSALAATFDRAQSQAERAAHRAMKLSSSLSEQLAGNLLSAATDIAGFDDQSAQTIRAIHADHLEIGKTL
ncbi:hypothetical protein [Microbacterium testaceum]|uniref:hypothetical protein n=1 Tax=Microbacterium testaceum TaxID=2033 RepID=UPI0024353EB2|nr:hypothetical protein [Microbacterium testaceum]MDZ5146063.1 hypothetical protein [Microbacterium testaceum]